MQFLIDDELKKKSGIYRISNNIDDRVYIGSCKEFRKRYCRHLNFLKRGDHHCIHLQRFVNKYGVESLSFFCLEVINDFTKVIAEERENFFLRSYPNKFNAKPDAFTMLGFKFTKEQRDRVNAGINKTMSTQDYKNKRSKIATDLWKSDEFKNNRAATHLPSVQSEEYRENMSKLVADRWKDKDYKERVMKSKRKAFDSEDYKEKVRKQMTGSKNNNAKLNESIVAEMKAVIAEAKMTFQQIADKFKVKKCTVEDIKYGNTWKHVAAGPCDH